MRRSTTGSKYGGLSVSELKRLKDLEAENARLSLRARRAEGRGCEKAICPDEKRTCWHGT